MKTRNSANRRSLFFLFRRYLLSIIIFSVGLPLFWLLTKDDDDNFDNNFADANLYRLQKGLGFPMEKRKAFRKLLDSNADHLHREIEDNDYFESIKNNNPSLGGASDYNSNNNKQVIDPDSLAGLQKCKYKPISFRENHAQASKKSSEMLKSQESVDFLHDVTPLNEWFYFYNRIPGSGTTSFTKILEKLSIANNFKIINIDQPLTTFKDEIVVNELRNLPPSALGCPGDGVQKNQAKKLVLIKDHFWFNFTEQFLPQPTYINLIRDPVEKFTAEYYRCRYGFKGKPDFRGPTCKYMTRERLDMTLDDCIKHKLEECTEPESFEYFMWLCGNDELCRTKNSNYQKKMLTSEFTKHRVLSYYYFIGIISRFEESMQILELIAPTIFKGGPSILSTDQDVLLMKNMSQTNNKYGLSDSSRRFLKQGPLKYEVDLYRFIERLFNTKVEKLLGKGKENEK